jgi:cell filamentation protein
VSFEGYNAFEDPYLYPGTDCLKNRLGLRDPRRLTAFEIEISTLQSEVPLPTGRFGPAHYCRVHRHLFGDVYSWAGRYRVVRTGKGGNWFCYPENIDHSMRTLFGRLKMPALGPSATEDRFLDALTGFLADLNAIHPFREGNGRTQLAFIDLIAVRAEKPLDLQKVRQDSFLPAMIESFSGHMDRLRSELGAMRI